MRDHAEVAASPSNGPEQVRVIALARAQSFSVRQDYVSGDQIVEQSCRTCASTNRNHRLV
jgi:hypothetical protein